jgi:hypothetical protein
MFALTDAQFPFQNIHETVGGMRPGIVEGRLHRLARV